MEEKKGFKVNLGDLIQLQYIPEDGRERLSAKVIGHSPGRSLIISTPRVNGSAPYLQESQPFVIRMMQGNKVYGFESSILKTFSSPFPHVHLEHPKSDVECITVRGSRRVQTELIVSVISDVTPQKPQSISMLDTSATGARLQTKENLGKLNDKLSISLELEVVKIKKYLRIDAVIRNISTTDDGRNLNKYGVQFINLKDDQILLINAYVYEQIVIHLDDD